MKAKRIRTGMVTYKFFTKWYTCMKNIHIYKFA